MACCILYGQILGTWLYPAREWTKHRHTDACKDKLQSGGLCALYKSGTNYATNQNLCMSIMHNAVWELVGSLGRQSVAVSGHKYWGWWQEVVAVDSVCTLWSLFHKHSYSNQRKPLLLTQEKLCDVWDGTWHSCSPVKQYTFIQDFNCFPQGLKYSPSYCFIFSYIIRVFIWLAQPNISSTIKVPLVMFILFIFGKCHSSQF